MKTLNFLFVMAICFMAISRVSATYYIVKTFENYGSKSTEGKEGSLDESGTKRVDCFTGLIGSKVNKLDAIFYKADGTDKNGNVKTVNSRRTTAEAIAAKLNLKAEAIEGGDAQLSTLKTSILDANKFNNVLFVWSDKDKTPKLATALGATKGVPEKFNKNNYGTIWVIEGDTLKEETMDCNNLANAEEKKSAAVSVRYSIMTFVAAAMASFYFLF